VGKEIVEFKETKRYKAVNLS